MAAEDLARLLMVAGKSGPLDLKQFESVFSLYEPATVKAWVDEFVAERESRSPRLTIDLFLKALESFDYDRRNTISSNDISATVRGLTGWEPLRREVETVAHGLHVLMPHLISLDQRDILLTTSPAKLREELRHQLKLIDEPYRFGMDKQL